MRVYSMAKTAASTTSNKAAAAAAAAAAARRKDNRGTSSSEIAKSVLLGVAIAMAIMVLMNGPDHYWARMKKWYAGKPTPSAHGSAAPLTFSAEELTPYEAADNGRGHHPLRSPNIGPSHPDTPPDVIDVYPVLAAIRDDPSLNVSVLWPRDASLAAVRNDEPLVLQIENFFTPAECAVLIKHMKDLGLERSTVVGGVKESGFNREHSPVRTSSNNWCMRQCFDDPVVQAMDERIMRLLDRPSRNYSEHFQMLEYKEGQYYKTHHDFIASQRDFGGGVRLYTFYIYLNDVEEGGETEFTDLGIKAMPATGRAIVWPDVQYNPPRYAEHPRTNHAALPVIRGVKYGTNKVREIGPREGRLCALMRGVLERARCVCQPACLID